MKSGAGTLPKNENYRIAGNTNTNYFNARGKIVEKNGCVESKSASIAAEFVSKRVQGGGAGSLLHPAVA